MITMLDYQTRAHETADTVGANKLKLETVAACALAGSAGDVAKCIAVRVACSEVEEKDTVTGVIDKVEGDMYVTLGQVLWCVAELCSAKGWNMNELARANLEKRKQEIQEETKDQGKKEEKKW